MSAPKTSLFTEVEAGSRIFAWPFDIRDLGVTCGVFNDSFVSDLKLGIDYEFKFQLTDADELNTRTVESMP